MRGIVARELNHEDVTTKSAKLAAVTSQEREENLLDLNSFFVALLDVCAVFACFVVLAIERRTL